MKQAPTPLLASMVHEAKPGFACGEEEAGGILQLRMNNVTKDGKLDLSKTRRVPREHPAVSRSLLRKGDVLFNATNSPDLVGKSLLFAGSEEVIVYSNHFLRIRADESKLAPGYLASWLQYNFSRGTFRGMCRQWVNQATVSKDSLMSLRVPVPPLAEQRHIAAVFDQVDVLRAKRRESITLLEDLGRSVFFDMFGDPSANLHGFDVFELNSLVSDHDRINYGVVQPGKHVDEGVPLIRAGDLGQGPGVCPARLV